MHKSVVSNLRHFISNKKGDVLLHNWQFSIDTELLKQVNDCLDIYLISIMTNNHH